MRILIVLAATIFFTAGSLAFPASAAADEQAVAVCAGCHGPGGHSIVADNPILAGQSADYLKAALNAYLDGSRDYGIMKTLVQRLNPGDIEIIARYYAAQTRAGSRFKVTTGDAQRGALKVGTCGACHGAGGESAIALYPNLAGQHAKYLRKALQAYKNGGRVHAMMAPMVAALSEQDIADIAAFYASLPVIVEGSAASSGGNGH